MSSVKNSLLRGVQEAIKYASDRKIGKRTLQGISDYKIHNVKVPRQVNIKDIRLQLHLSRNEFSDKFGFNPRTLEKWEQGTRYPDTTTRAYLTVIARNPVAVNQALASAQR